MLIPVRSRQFKRDVRKAEKRGKNMNKLHTLLSLLIEEKPLPRRYCDHPLKGDWVRCIAKKVTLKIVIISKG
ncbi:type II toxin-antitoxin system RelE/ParE family toxin [Bartonella doshiae]|uniref:mRNA interferase YafQ n=2 Tax=Bartonella doshiae TaxID=33044 RepID=A0A380ZEI8_BARDO|nr:RelE/StbE family addiction module toxin [Bartonella doshiae NCTC 12862 = ATCC 700133]MBB6160074.1 mRNA interferase YafQ [Bartonella doshiae]SUV45388.1 mRNA interferase YafQ [Bartonella doshiae]